MSTKGSVMEVDRDVSNNDGDDDVDDVEMQQEDTKPVATTMTTMESLDDDNEGDTKSRKFMEEPTQALNDNDVGDRDDGDDADNDDNNKLTSNDDKRTMATTDHDDSSPSSQKQGQSMTATTQDMEVDETEHKEETNVQEKNEPTATTTTSVESTKPLKSKKRKSHGMESGDVDDDGGKSKTEMPKKKKTKTTRRGSSSKKKGMKTTSSTSKAEEEAEKKKRKKRRLFQKKKKPSRLSLSSDQMQLVREQGLKDFLEEKTEILEYLPAEYKLQWGQVGYSSWNKVWLPCLVVGPYHVGPETEMRKIWMDMYEKAKESHKAPTQQLVYWYGQEDSSNKFSFAAVSKIVTYDQGVAKGYNKIDSKIQKKIDEGKKLTKSQRELVAGHQGLEDDLQKQPEDRTKFDYRTDEENFDDDKFLMNLAKVYGYLSDENISAEDSSDESGLVSSAGSELDSDSDGQGEDAAVVKPRAKKIKRPKESKEATAAIQPVVEEEDLSFAEDEVSSSDESKDEDVKLSDVSDDEGVDDEADADYIVNEKATKKKTPSKPKKERKPKETARRKQRSQPSKKKVPTEMTERGLKARETKTFQQNEEMFIPILEQLDAAIKIGDPNDINHILQKLLENVDLMGAPFMEAYNVSPIMKRAKKVLKENQTDLSTHKTLLSRLGVLYLEKKKFVPKGYTPKLRKEIEAKAAKKKEIGAKTAKKEKAAKAKMQVARENEKAAKSVSKPAKTDLESMKPPLEDRLERAHTEPGSQQLVEAPATPARRVLSQGSSTPEPRVKPSPSPLKPGVSQGSKSTAPKQEKPTFSLNRLINKPVSSQHSKSDEDSRIDSRQASQSAPVSRGPPSWMTTPPPDEVGELPSKKVDRMLALDFFYETACCFPEEAVSKSGIARSLEAALYQWSQEQSLKEDTYWTKLHAVVAGICGKRKPGSLLAAMMAGEYETARDVILLSDDILHHSFEGN